MLLCQGSAWTVRNSAGIWPVDGPVELAQGTYVEGQLVERMALASSLHTAKPVTIEEAADLLHYSPQWPAINLWEARRIAKALGTDAAEQLREDPWLIDGLVGKPMRVVAAWAGLGTVTLL